MDILVDVIFEMALILFIGFICFTVYIYTKLFLIKIGLIRDNQDEESEEKI